MLYTDAFFDAGIERIGTDCEKWDCAIAEHGEGILPLWVADMDFASPPEVRQAIETRALHGTYGYTAVMDKDYQAFMAFWQRRHQLPMKQEELQMLPCVVTGIEVAIQALTGEGDGVVIQPPVYGPFEEKIKQNNRLVVENPLVKGEDGRYGMDLAQLESLFASGTAKLMLLCSPHNPLSRVWTREELQKLVQLADKYQITIVADEIHADFVYKPNTFVPLLSLGYSRTIMLAAASKTFNLAGLQQAMLVCRNKALLEKLSKHIQMNGIRSGNIFALCATRTAYNEGDAWLDGLLAYLAKGRDLLLKQIAREIPQAVVAPIEATYLAFIDCRAYHPSCDALQSACLREKVMFTQGTFFSQTHGEGFIRFNFACPHKAIVEGVKRLKKALEE